MTAFEAHNARGTWQAETLDDLCRQLGGTHWRLEPEPLRAPTQRVMLVLRRGEDGAHIVHDRVIVPAGLVENQVAHDLTNGGADDE